MPYNTRRKSLSLPSLGIQLPHTSRAHRSNSKSTPSSELPQPATKRIKRSHDDEEPPSPISSPRSKTGSPAVDLPTIKSQAKRRGVEHTPPPSPRAAPVRKVDTDGINDDIVIAVIEQLERTGNRPHLIRDLAAVLASSNESIAHSANPAALLSSRLSLYLKRPWTALSPCPLAKELIPVHPRKVFFYLTTQPRMPLPESSDDIIAPSLNQIKQLTPSISDPSVGGDDMDLDVHERSRMSPSPEVELFSPELEHESSVVGAPATPAEAFSGRDSFSPDSTPEVRRRPNHRAPSPSLEADERGFTETATAVRARGMSLHDPTVQIALEVEETHRPTGEETPEQGHKRDQELGFALFGASNPDNKHLYTSSPMIQPRQDHHVAIASSVKTNPMALLHHHLDDLEIGDSLNNVLSPESIGVEELDVLFSEF